MLSCPRSEIFIRSVLGLALGGIALTSCGRNPGAQARSYPIPGIEKYEKQKDNAKARCVKVNFDRLINSLRRKSVVQGKELFTSDRAGSFRLEKYELSKASDRYDDIMPNVVIQVTDFEDLVSRAPRLSIEATCTDTKGLPQELKLSPVLEIDSDTGIIQSTQPFVLNIPAQGNMFAISLDPAPIGQPIPVSRIPSEAAMLLGAENADGLKTVTFHVKESEDGSMEVKAEFVGVDAEFSRIVIQVRAVYRWDAAA